MDKISEKQTEACVKILTEGSGTEEVQNKCTSLLNNLNQNPYGWPEWIIPTIGYGLIAAIVFGVIWYFTTEQKTFKESVMVGLAASVAFMTLVNFLS